MKKFNLIAAVSLNGVIGNSELNSIPWYIPADLKYFRSKTFSKTIIMGSKTFDSIGKPLLDRRNIVLTRSEEGCKNYIKQKNADGAYSDLRTAIDKERPDFFIIGGSQVYKQSFDYSPSRLFITIVKLDSSGDVRFPVEGSLFLRNQVYINDRLQYNCSKRSGWLADNGVEFQFTEFDLAV